jgi:hypothetical protein
MYVWKNSASGDARASCPSHCLSVYSLSWSPGLTPSPHIPHNTLAPVPRASCLVPRASCHAVLAADVSPVKQFGDAWVLELFHGPTFAFKVRPPFDSTRLDVVPTGVDWLLLFCLVAWLVAFFPRSLLCLPACLPVCLSVVWVVHPVGAHRVDRGRGNPRTPAVFNKL